MHLPKILFKGWQESLLILSKSHYELVRVSRKVQHLLIIPEEKTVSGAC